MRYSEIICQDALVEGLIPVPQNMFRAIAPYVTQCLLWWARDRIQERGVKFRSPALYNAFKELVREQRVKIPNEPFCSQYIKVPLDFSDLPARYGSDTTEGTINVQFDGSNSLGGRGLGAYYPTHRTLVVNPLGFYRLANYPSSSSNPQDLAIGLDRILEAIQHELRHMVQDFKLGDHPEQIRKLPAYRDNTGDEYHASPIEFDPQIGTAVQGFVERWNHYRAGLNTPPTAEMKTQAIRQFVGASPQTEFGDIFPVWPFFSSMKKIAPERYKTAIKKFTTELYDVLSRAETPKARRPSHLVKRPRR
jgi:hypothetical protein